MPTFFIILIFTYLGGNAYIFYRGLQTLSGFPYGIKILLTVLFWLAALSRPHTLCGISKTVSSHCDLASFRKRTGWLIFTLYMVLFLLFFDLLKLCSISFNQSFMTSLLATFVLLGYGYYNYRHPKINTVNITLTKPLTDNRRPIKIVAVSDIHLGNGTGKTSLKQYVKMINGQNPDLILIGGDLIDNSVIPLYAENMAEELTELKAPLGIYMVPGNHEYISGIDKSIQFIQNTPIQLLRDSVVTLPCGIQLIGRDDRSNARRLPLQKLMARIDKSKPVILLDHQPYQLAESQAAGIDLQFSGHTHHGQVWPMNWVTDHLYEQSHGYRQWENSHIYVSSGLSLWGPPFRIGTESEMVVLQLH